MAIDSFTNDEIMANDINVLADNLYQEYYIEPLFIREEDCSHRKITQDKIKRPIDPFFRDPDNPNQYIEVEGIVGQFYYPFSGDRTLFECRASSFLLNPYPNISIHNRLIELRIERTLQQMKTQSARDEVFNELEQKIEQIKTGVGYVNNDVTAFNNSLKEKITEKLIRKKEQVEQYYGIARMFEVPVEKTPFAEKHIPIQRRIVPISHKYKQEDNYYISDADYQDILLAIKHTLSTFERTPCTYKSLEEEDLRDALLATLNSTYKGAATGETFRRHGKTDICIEQENRAAFVGECKIWSGPKNAKKAIVQLDNYLTWRDCKTSLIFFVRNKNYMSILETAEKTLRSFEKMKSVYAVDKNEFKCFFHSESNPGQIIEMRVMLFNLYCNK